MSPAPDHMRDNPPAALTLSQVEKSFNETRILPPFSLSVPEGQRLALLGRSGSGKTLVLRLIAGLERPDAGEITLFGRTLPYRRIAGRLIPDDPPDARDRRHDVGIWSGSRCGWNARNVPSAVRAGE